MKFLKRSNDALAGLMITTSPLSARAAASCTAVSRFSTSIIRGMLALDILYALANLGCSSAGEQQQLYMVADRLTEHVIRDMLVVATRDEDDFLLEGTVQSCDGMARRTGGDGVVVDTSRRPFRARTRCGAQRRRTWSAHGADIVVRGITLHDSRRHHHVVHVVRARNADVGCGHQLTAHAAVRDVDHAVLEEHAVGQLLRFAGAEQDCRMP